MKISYLTSVACRGRWFSPGTPASSTTKTGRHDIAEILLKVALNNTSINPPQKNQQSNTVRNNKIVINIYKKNNTIKIRFFMKFEVGLETNEFPLSDVILLN